MARLPLVIASLLLAAQPAASLAQAAAIHWHEDLAAARALAAQRRAPLLVVFRCER